MSIILTKEFLENEYCIKKIDVKDIANQTGFSYSYIQSKIKKFGIPRRRQYKDLVGLTFGKLTVKEFSHTDKKQQSWWKCLCSCGKEKTVRSQNLKGGYTKSCGCIYLKRCGDISGGHFSNIKSHARWRKLEFNLKIEDIWNLYLKQNKKCALSGIEILFDNNRGKTTASLDRIDSSKGYIIDNVQWVHKDINQMKSDRKIEDFLKWINLIHAYNNHN